MHETLEKKTAALQLYVLDVLDQIEASQGLSPAPDEVRPRIKHLLGMLDLRGADESTCRLAKAALVFWIDEVLVNSTWSFASDWKDHPLERELYGTRSRAWRFFQNAQMARGLEHPDALEVFALCAAFGFRGVYRNAAFRNGDDEIPAKVVNWDNTPPGPAAPAGFHESDLPEPAVAVLSAQAVATRPLNGAARRAETETIAALPLQFEDWAGSLAAEIREPALTPFAPQSMCDSPRDARPLRGMAAFTRWALAFGAAALLTAILHLVGGRI